jgi:hypothetical protein
MLELADELPDSSPRFVLLSYPLTLVRFYPSILSPIQTCTFLDPISLLFNMLDLDLGPHRLVRVLTLFILVRK